MKSRAAAGNPIVRQFNESCGNDHRRLIALFVAVPPTSTDDVNQGGALERSLAEWLGESAD